MEGSKVKDDVQGRVPYEYIQNIFSKADPIEISNRSLIPYTAERCFFTIELMGRKYKVVHPSGKLYDMEEDNEITAYTIKTLILRYLMNSKAVPPFNMDITYKEIPGGLVYYSNFYRRTILKLPKVFSNGSDTFKLGSEAVKAKLLNKADLSCKFEFINNVFFTFLIWEGDDELPASANILFDRNIEYYFNAEDLAVAGDVAIEILKNRGKIPNWIGLYQKKNKEGYEIN